MAEEIVVADTSTGEEGHPDTGTASTETVDVEALKLRVAELEDANPKLFARAKKAEGFVLVDNKWVKPAKVIEKLRPEVETTANTGELDETQLELLDLKGISEQEDIDVVQKVMQRTGMTLRLALKDDYVQAKLKAQKEAREVQNAMPSSTKRANAGGAQSVQAAIAKFEATGELPADFKLRSEVVNAMVDKKNTNKPSWH